MVTIRYIGKVAANNNPYLRLEADTRSKASILLLRQLQTAVETVLPNFARGPRSYLLSDSVLGYYKGRPPLALVNMYERFFVAFFDHRSPISHQSGRVRIGFNPPIEDELMSLKLQTSFRQKISSKGLQ